MFILRGLPGSGKSTLCKKMSDIYRTDERDIVVCSGDDFFTDKKTGEYKWKAEKLDEAHASARNKAIEACK